MIGDEVEDPDKHQRHRLGQVQGLLEARVAQNLVRVPQVRVDVRGRALFGADQESTGVRQDNGVVVHVDDPRFRGQPLGGLVDGPGHGQAGADVEELPHSPVNERADGVILEPAREPRGLRHPRHLLGHGAHGVPVSREIVLAPQTLIISWAGNHTCEPEPGYVMSA
jgi:hypothetical protein